MEKAKRKRLKIVALICSLVCLISVCAIGAFAASTAGSNAVDETVEIKAAFDANYLVQNTAEWTDKYVGKFKYTVYYDAAKGTPTIGYENTTPIILYTVNHPTAVKVGTKSNVDIIQSMLDRGYVVMVLDYLQTKANTEMLGSSTQAFRQEISRGKVLTFSSYSGAKPWNHFVCPAGCDVLLEGVFWEIDKHSTNGTLEKIVENWNTDLKTSKPNSYVKWATGNTVDTRKKTTSDVVWYNADKKVDENGLYTQLKYTIAEKITDCVDPDGSFIDMNLYINIVYPTNPVTEVPVMSLANSSGQPRTSVATDSAYLRPHSNHFLYEGYANVVFDYLWMPMARNASFGYYDGSSGNTGDHMNYAVMMYNDKLVNTAAMRYLRHISEEKADIKFDLDAFGVYGNSKGGWFSYLGEEILQSELATGTYSSLADREAAINEALSALVPKRYYEGHHGETRYQVGASTYTDSVTGFTIKGGEMQPWLTYQSGSMAGEEIISGAQFTNATNGSQEEDMTAGHVPVFVVSNMKDDYNAAYSFSLNMYNICRELDIPMLHFELPIGHTLVEGNDMNYNVSSYDMYFKYIGYFLKNNAIDIATVSPMDKNGNTGLDAKIKISFTGIAVREEVEKITVTLGGEAVNGIWESSFGGVTWEFTPTELLTGGATYTVTVPAGFKGDNGVAMENQYTTTFMTKSDKVTELTPRGSYYTFTAPSSFTFGNGYAFRFVVSNDAANVAELYAVSDSSATSGELLGKVNLRGKGTYEIDISDFIAAHKGEEVTLLLKGAKPADIKEVLSSENASVFLTNANAVRKNSVFAQDSINGTDAVSVIVNATTKKPSSSNPLSVYYGNPTQILTYKNIMGGVLTTAENYGRRFTVSFDIYDTTDRVLLVNLNSMTKREAYGTIDYDNVYFNVSTKANEWVHVEFTYEIYEPDYGFPSDTNTQSMHLYLSPSGDLAKKAYIKGLSVTEKITDVNVSAAGLAETDDGSGFDYVSPVSDKPVALYNGAAKVGEYATLKDAFEAFVSGYTVKLQSDYTLTDDGIYSGIGGFAEVNIDLGGYTLYTANKTGALIYDKSSSAASTAINISGGKIKIGRTALISFADAVAERKTFDINFTYVNIGFAENSFATELVCASAIKSGASITADIDFVDCIFDFDDGMHSKDASTVFSAPAAKALKLSYGITGGEIRIDSQRWVTVSENANLVEFFEGVNGYTKLIMPESVTKAVNGSYLMKDGYASYLKTTATNLMAVYTLACDENSTRYGVITENYLNTTEYPFLVFKDGSLVGGYDTLVLAVKAANELLAGADLSDAQAEILMRADFDNASEISFGSTNGTILIDLGGHTLKRTSNIINAVINSNTVFDYPTTVTFYNGTILANNSEKTENGTVKYGVNPLGTTHVLKSTTEVKTFNINFEKVTLGFRSDYKASGVGGVFWSVWQNNHSTETKTNITYTDCTFDLETNAPSGGGSLINVSEAKADVNIKLLGGQIISNGAAYTFAKLDSEDNLTAGVGTDGKLPSLKVKTGGKAVADNFKSAGGEYTNFTSTEKTEGGYDIYELTVNKNVTDYGVIPTEVAKDTETYPFILFANGEYVSAHGTWKSAVSAAASAVSGNTSSSATILMRRNYDAVKVNDQSTNFNTAKGTVIVDLAGYTLNNVDNYTIDVSVNYSTATHTGYESRIVFKNGTMKNSRSDSADARPMIALGHSNSADGKTVKKYSFTFNNVTFEFGSGANSIISEWNHDGQGLETTYIFNDCTIKFDGAANGAFAVGVADSKKKQKSTVIFNGGAIEATNFKENGYKVVSYNDYDSVTFAKSVSTGKYTTLTTASTAKDFEHSTTTYNTEEGVRYFVEVADDGVKSTYELLSMTFGDLTGYVNKGKNLSVVDYPFYVFVGTEPSSVRTSWSDALSAATSKATDENTVVTIVMRYNYTATAGTNFNSAKGKIVLDLNGYTLTATKYIVDCYVNYTTANYLDFKSTFEVKNGTIVNDRISDNGSLPIFGFQHQGTSGTKVKEIDLIFTGVTFKYQNTSKYMIAEFTGKTGDGLVLGYYFNNCTVDFTNALSGSRLLNCNDTSTGAMVSKIEFKGGTVIAPNLTDYKIANLFNGDSLTYEIDDNGQYTAVILPSSVSAPTHTSFVGSNKAGVTLTLGWESENGNSVVYRLGAPVSTVYGDIPFTYANAERYPFVIFNEKGEFVNADDTFLDIVTPFDNEGAFNAAKVYMTPNVYSNGSYGDNPRAAIILMRRDYAMASNEAYNNISQLQGTLTFDLGGFTLTAPNDRAVIPFSIKPWGGSGDANIFPSEIVFENGNIVIKNKAVVEFQAWTGDASRPNDYVEGKDASVKFVNVNIKVGGNADSLVSYSVHSDTPDATAVSRVSYENCVFDLTSAAKKVTLFSGGNGKVKTAVSVLGCEIKAANSDKFTLCTDAGSVTFGTDSNGKLLAVTLNKGAGAPTGEYLTVIGACAFDKESENALTETYRLVEKALAEFKVKTGVSLDSDLVFNIYVPNHALLKSFTVDGMEYTKNGNGLEIVNVDGVEYFKISISRLAAKSAGDIEVTATLALVSGDTVGSWTVSLITYVDGLLDSADSTAEEKQLACDMLFYVRNAYAYFTELNSAEVIADVTDAIDSVIGVSYGENAEPDSSKTPLAPTADTGITGASFNLGAKPSFIFVLASGVNADDFTFTQGGKTLDKTVMDGYVVVTADAPCFAGDVSFVGKNAGGEDVSGSYNVESYLAWVTDADNAKSTPELVGLVKSFMKYCQSAEAYKNSATNN